jgi:hypothetical protein
MNKLDIIESIIDELEDQIYSIDWAYYQYKKQKIFKIQKIVESITGYRISLDDNKKITQVVFDIFGSLINGENEEYENKLIEEEKYQKIQKFRNRSNNVKPKYIISGLLTDEEEEEINAILIKNGYNDTEYGSGKKYEILKNAVEEILEYRHDSSYDQSSDEFKTIMKYFTLGPEENWFKPPVWLIPEILAEHEFEIIKNLLEEYDFINKDNEYKFKISSEIITNITDYKQGTKEFGKVIKYVWMWCHNILNPKIYTKQEKQAYAIYEKNMKICEDSNRRIMPKFTVDDVILKNFIDSYVDDPNWNGNLTFLENKIKKRMIEVWRLPLDAQIMNVNTGEILDELAFDYIWIRLIKAIKASGKNIFYGKIN